MKKLFSAALILTMVFALSACGGKKQEPMPATTVPTTASTTVPTTAATTTEPAGTNIIPATTMGTNIPDPSVDRNSTEPEENTTGTTNGNGHNGSNGSGNNGNEGRMGR